MRNVRFREMWSFTSAPMGFPSPPHFCSPARTSADAQGGAAHSGEGFEYFATAAGWCRRIGEE